MICSPILRITEPIIPPNVVRTRKYDSRAVPVPGGMNHTSHLSSPQHQTHRHNTMAISKGGFPSLPNELVLQIALYADDSSLLSLLKCNAALCILLTPVLNTRAFASRGPQTAMEWAASHGRVSLVKVCPSLPPPHQSFDFPLT